jgi:VanZ family protein
MQTPIFQFVSEPHLRAVFWFALVSLLALALLPSNTVQDVMLFSDKVMHALAFLLLATLGYWSYPKHVIYVVGGLLVYGALIEFFQALTETRAPEWGDWLADALGIIIALLLIRVRRFLFK